MNMGLTAEKLFAMSGLTKEDMDKWGVRSHQLAAKAQTEGFFKEEILPIEAEQGDGKKMIVDKDQAVRGDTTLEQMKDLKPAYKPDGDITAGNSSPLNAAATSMILMSKETAQEERDQALGDDPVHRVCRRGPHDHGRRAGSGQQEGSGERPGLQVKDIDYWEINEAFAIVPLYCIKELGLNPDRVNVMGGGLAIGHPLGATGVRLVGTLARILEKQRAAVTGWPTPAWAAARAWPQLLKGKHKKVPVSVFSVSGKLAFYLLHTDTAQLSLSSKGGNS